MGLRRRELLLTAALAGLTAALEGCGGGVLDGPDVTLYVVAATRP